MWRALWGYSEIAKSLELSKTSERKFQIQAASDLNSEQTKRVNFPEVLMRHLCFEDICVMTRKGQQEGQKKWVSLVGSNQTSIFSKASMCGDAGTFPM